MIFSKNCIITLKYWRTASEIFMLWSNGNWKAESSQSFHLRLQKTFLGNKIFALGTFSSKLVLYALFLAQEQKDFLVLRTHVTFNRRTLNSYFNQDFFYTFSTISHLMNSFIFEQRMEFIIKILQLNSSFIWQLLWAWTNPSLYFLFFQPWKANGPHYCSSLSFYRWTM